MRYRYPPNTPHLPFENPEPNPQRNGNNQYYSPFAFSQGRFETLHERRLRIRAQRKALAFKWLFWCLATVVSALFWFWFIPNLYYLLTNAPLRV